MYSNSNGHCTNGDGFHDNLDCFRVESDGANLLDDIGLSPYDEGMHTFTTSQGIPITSTTRQDAEPASVRLRTMSASLVEDEEPAIINTSGQDGEPPSVRLRTISASLVEDEVHCHHPQPRHSNKARNQLIVVSFLCVAFMIAEIAGGLISGSLALITDATHLASDISGFLVSLFAIWISKKPATVRMSFGFYRAEVLGALVSILIIWIVTAVLCYLAVERLISKDFEIKADEMLITASLGVVFNIIMGAVLHTGLCCKCDVPHAHFGGHDHSHSHGHSHGHSHANITDDHHGTFDHTQRSDHDHSQNEAQGSLSNNLQLEHCNEDANDNTNIVIVETQVPEKAVMNINVKAAFIHVIGDLIQSIGVLIAAIIIKVEPTYKIADPICTFLFSVLVLITTITVLHDIVLVIMEAVPKNVSYNHIREDLCSINGVKAVHSLHIWALSMDKVAMTAHLAIEADFDSHCVLKHATKMLKDQHGAFQSTVQVEIYQEHIMKNCTQCIGPKKHK